MTEQGVLTMPCLGRPMQLGMLYDCRNDQLIPGITLWNEEKLQKALNSNPQEASGFDVMAENSIESKMSKLGVDAHLKTSFLGGLVKVSGAAKYLDDQLSSKNQARISLKYHSTSKFEQLTMEQLGHLDYPKVIEEHSATHVVTGVVYGADAIFVFDREVSKSENFRKVHGHMKAVIKGLHVSGGGGVHMKDTDKKEFEKFDCTFHGDLYLPKNPSTFEEAVEIYKQLPSLPAHGEKDVPKQVWLYPLSKLERKAAKFVREISSNLVSQVQTAMEDLHELEMECSDLMKSEVYDSFTDIREQLSSFKDNITEYRVEFAGDLATVLPQIRGGGKKEAELASILTTKENSPFSHQHLSSWITGKKQEEKVLKAYLKFMPENVQFAASPGDMDSVVNDLNYDHVVSFTFKIASRPDPYLNEMLAYLRTHKISNPDPAPAWYENGKLIQDMRVKAGEFKSLANKKDQKTLFVMTSGESDKSGKGAIIKKYENGILDQEGKGAIIKK